MQYPPPAATWPAIRQRAHYLCWLFAAAADAALVGLTFDLVLVEVTGGVVGFDLGPLFVLTVVLTVNVYLWRKHGEACCGFLELERAIDASLRDGAHRRTARFARIVAFVGRIEAARGMDRQVVRNEAKAWLEAHASELSRDERDYVADHLGYLQRGRSGFAGSSVEPPTSQY